MMAVKATQGSSFMDGEIMIDNFHPIVERFKQSQNSENSHEQSPSGQKIGKQRAFVTADSLKDVLETSFFKAHIRVTNTE